MIIIIALFPISLSAQSNFQPGYVVTLKGDTLHGYLDYREWYKNPDQTIFKNNIAGTAHRYQVDSIKAFGINSKEYFEQYIVSKTMGHTGVADLATGIDTASRVDTVFLKVLTRGKNIILFVYTDDIKTRFYFAPTASGTPKELLYYNYFDPEKTDQVVTIKRYRAQLNYAAQQFDTYNSKIKSMIDEANYTEASFLKIARLINNTKDNVASEKSIEGLSWFAGAGINSNSAKINSEIASTFYNSKKTQGDIFPKIDGGINIYFNKSIQRFYFRGEIAFSGYSINANYNIGNDVTTNIKIKQYNASLIPQLVYNIYNTQPLKVFINGGISLTYALNSSFGYMEKIISTNAENKIDLGNYLNKNSISFPVRAGIVIKKKFEIYALYTTAIKTDEFNLTTYGGGVNYIFGR